MRLMGLVGGLAVSTLLSQLAPAQDRPTPSSTDPQQSVHPSPPAEVQVPNRPAAPLFAAEQGRQKAEINYDPQTRLVTLELIIQDSSGYFIPNIRRENFAVYENGIRQPEPSVDIEHAAVCAGVLVEYGGRYHALSEARASAVSMAVGQFADEIESQDTVAIWKYADRVEELSGFSKGNGALQQAAPNLRSTPPFSELNFYDALISTLPRLEEQSGRRALILFSSGIDTFSKATYPDALRAAGRSSAPIYAINVGPATRGDASLYGLNGPYARLDWKSAESNLGHIAQASGGRMYSPQSILDLSGVYDDLMENLRVRYVISYRSTVRPGEHGPRTVRVELVDSRTGGPLHIVDADGKPVHARVIAAVSYDPDRGTTS